MKGSGILAFLFICLSVGYAYHDYYDNYGNYDNYDNGGEYDSDYEPHRPHRSHQINDYQQRPNIKYYGLTLGGKASSRKSKKTESEANILGQKAAYARSRARARDTELGSSWKDNLSFGAKHHVLKNKKNSYMVDTSLGGGSRKRERENERAKEIGGVIDR